MSEVEGKEWVRRAGGVERQDIVRNRVKLGGEDAVLFVDVGQASSLVWRLLGEQREEGAPQTSHFDREETPSFSLHAPPCAAVLKLVLFSAGP